MNLYEEQYMQQYFILKFKVLYTGPGHYGGWLAGLSADFRKCRWATHGGHFFSVCPSYCDVMASVMWYQDSLAQSCWNRRRMLQVCGNTVLCLLFFFLHWWAIGFQLFSLLILYLIYGTALFLWQNHNARVLVIFIHGCSYDFYSI